MRERDIGQRIERTRPSSHELADVDLEAILRRARRRDRVTRSSVALAAVGAAVLVVAAALVVLPSGAPLPMIDSDAVPTSAEMTAEEASFVLDRAVALAAPGVPRADWDALEAETARCMAGQGLTYEPQPYPAVKPELASQRWDLAAPARINLDGWSPPHGLSTLNPGASGLDDSSAAGYAEALLGPGAVDAPGDMREITGDLDTISSVRVSTSGCRTEAMREVLADPDGTVMLAAAIRDIGQQRMDSVDEDPAAKSAVTRWQECLEREGVGPALRDSEGRLLTKLDADVRARIARGCADDAELVEVLVTTDHEVSLELRERNEALLREFMDRFGA